MRHNEEVYIRRVRHGRIAYYKGVVLEAGWSCAQLSSGQAEYYGVVRAAGLGLGQQALHRNGGCFSDCASGRTAQQPWALQDDRG